MQYRRHLPGPDGFGVISDIDDTVKAEVAIAVLYGRCSLHPVWHKRTDFLQHSKCRARDRKTCSRQPDRR